MNLHEYQAKALLARFGVPVDSGSTARSADEAVDCARHLGGSLWVVKAQVHAGGRGKAGGVTLARSLDEVRAAAEKMLGSQLVTGQSAPAGQPVHTLLITGGVDIARELYVGVLVDREARRITLIASAAGGMDIETVAAETPEQILTETIHPSLGFRPYQGRKLGFGLGLDRAQTAQLCELLDGLVKLFEHHDASMVELNPLAVLGNGQLMALDAKINLDDNGLFRQPELADWRDPTQEDPAEREAAEYDLNYVTLDGDIACMVNGAGLAMATMDIVKLYGGDPANFLDVGGGATAERVTEAFKIITQSARVRAILINIFGGIVRCDLIAEGIIEAVREVGVRVPVVVRLEGTNVAEGKALLADSGLTIISADSLADAAEKAVAAAQEA